MGVITTAITICVSSFDGGSYQSISNETRPINMSSANTQGAVVYYNVGNNSESRVFWRFDCSFLPEDITINSVSCYAKVYTSYIVDSGWTVQPNANLYSTTAIGAGVGTAQNLKNQNYVTITGGTWTRNQLVNGCYIGFYGKRNTNDTSRSLEARLYAAELTINFSYDDKAIAILTPSSYAGAIGKSYAAGVDNPVGKDWNNTTIAYAYCSGTSGVNFWSFDCSQIPANAKINSVKCLVKVRFSRSDSSYIRTVGLYSGHTSADSLKGQAINTSNFDTNSSSSNKFIISQTGSWTREELNDCCLGCFINHTGSGSVPPNSIYYSFYGASLIVTYTTETCYQKRSNTWTDVSFKTVYKKINNVWVEQDDLPGVFQDDEVYFTGSTGDITTVQFGVNGILKQNDEQ